MARTNWLPAAAWGGLALAGQAASLQMIDAGRQIHFQHYRLVAELLDQERIALVLFGFQAVCVGVGIWRRRTSILSRLRGFKWWQLVLALLFLMFASSAVTPDSSVYLTNLTIGSMVQLTNILNAVLLVWSIPLSAVKPFRGKVDRS